MDAELAHALATAMTRPFRGDRAQDFTARRPTAAQMRADLAAPLWDVPESEELRSEGDWQDRCAERDYMDDPLLDDRPHTGGARWEALVTGEDARG